MRFGIFQKTNPIYPEKVSSTDNQSSNDSEHRLECYEINSDVVREIGILHCARIYQVGKEDIGEELYDALMIENFYSQDLEERQLMKEIDFDVILKIFKRRQLFNQYITHLIEEGEDQADLFVQQLGLHCHSPSPPPSKPPQTMSASNYFDAMDSGTNLPFGQSLSAVDPFTLDNR
jgi:hypothetical protein